MNGPLCSVLSLFSTPSQFCYNCLEQFGAMRDPVRGRSIMKSQNLKKAALLNLALPAVMLLGFASLAYAQSNSEGIQASGPNGMLQAKDVEDKKAVKEYINRMDTDDQYQKTIREQPSAKASNDPWGSVRPTTTPTTPAAKTAAKTATGTKSKPVGAAVKPSVDNAASATSATAKSQ
jgi:hypothetical protein